MLVTGEAASPLVILERAMQIEREGRGFYLRVARLAHDEAEREVFRNLADDEGKHLELIRRQHRGLLRDGRWPYSPEVQPVPVDLDKPLFPRGRAVMEQLAEKTSGDAEALLFGLAIESRSFDMYRKAAAEVADDQGRKTLEFLAGEESLHFDILMMRYELRFGSTAWSA